MSKFVMIDSHTLPDADFHQEKEILKNNNIECVLGKCTTEDEIVELAKDAEYLGDNYFKITGPLLDKLPKVKAIVRYGIGYDVVDVDACSKRNIALCNLPTYCLEDVATHAFALLLDITRKTTVFNNQVKKGNWDVGYGYPTVRLSSKVLGLVGFGNIAKRLSVFAKAFDMKIVAYDPFVDAQTMDSYNVTKVELNALYKESDYISLHVPSTKDTIHMINKNSINQMKDNVVLINTSRGNLICNEDLVAALKSKKILACGLDVIEGEPIKDKDHPLLQFENVIVTPHSAYNSIQASDEQHTQVANTVVALNKGEDIKNIVNKKDLSTK